MLSTQTLGFVAISQGSQNNEDTTMAKIGMALALVPLLLFLLPLLFIFLLLLIYCVFIVIYFVFVAFVRFC